MKNYFGILGILIGLIVLIQSCKKSNDSTIECFPEAATIRQITTKQATIKLTNGQFYIIENGTVDTKLNPCNLAKDFQVNDLPVTISGDVKATTQSGQVACCTENFVISAITR